VNAPQQNRQGVFALREGDEMHMVRHEAPAQEAGLGVLEVLAQKAEVGGTVLVGREGLAAINAPLGDMARSSSSIQRLRRGIC
jgi:hypothetical protein